MRVLILGGDGMLGHQLVRRLRESCETYATVRQGPAAYPAAAFLPERTSFGVDVRDPDGVRAVLARVRPDAVVNAVGIVKQRDVPPLDAIEVNAAFPHRLAALCREGGTRLVHMSTDCVFSGRRGGYTERDAPDPVDDYGRTKLLGEVTGAGCVTLRSSIVGPEWGRRQGLVEWFRASRGTIQGFRRAIFSGLTTFEMSRVIERVLLRHGDLAGLWHVAAAPLDKHAFLSMLKEALGREDVTIAPDDALACDRSLSAAAFEAATGYRAPAWPDMLQELAQELSVRGE